MLVVFLLQKTRKGGDTIPKKRTLDHLRTELAYALILGEEHVNDMPLTLKHLNEFDTPELRRFTLQLLSNADINIDSYEIDARTMDNLPKPIREIIGDSAAPGIAYNVMTGHTLQGDKHFFLDLSEDLMSIV